MVLDTGVLSRSSLTVTTLTLYSTPGIRLSKVQEFWPASTNSSTLFPSCPLVGVQVTLYPVISKQGHSQSTSRTERKLDENLYFFSSSGCSGVPGVAAPFHWTMSSPVFGFDSRLRSVGGDKAGDDSKKQTSAEGKSTKN